MRLFPLVERAGSAACVLIATGCAPFRCLDLPAEPAHARTESQTRHGLTVAARWIGDAFASRHHFGADLRHRGFVPVLVFFEGAGEDSFDLRREGFRIVLENGERLEPAPPREVITSLQRSKVPAYLLSPLIVPPFLVARRIDEYNFEVARSFTAKSFPSSLRFEKGDPPFCKAVFFHDPLADERPPAEFESAALEVDVEIVGARPEDAIAAGGGKKPRVGNLIHFTVALSREELP
jgi:hypothetical protein